MNKLRNILASIMPGIFLIGYNIGTGSITSMSKAGANFGLDLLWTLAVSCLITYYLINLFSRYTMVTGETIMQGIKKNISPWLAVALIIPLSIIIVSALMGVLGIIASVLEEWSYTAFDTRVSAVWWAMIVSGILYILLLVGNYPIFEKILALLVGIMSIAFITTMFVNFPSLSNLAEGFIPKIPETTVAGSDNNSMIIIAGLVGTTVSVFAFIIRSQIVQGIGWQMKDNAVQKRDAAISASMMFIISAAVMITAATTLHAQGIKLNDVVEMVPLLEPIAGKMAMGFFVIGIVAAGLSSHLPNLLVIPWLIIDFREQERDTRTVTYRIILFVLSVFSIIGVIMGFKPVFIMLISQACISIVLPITIAAVMYLTSSKRLMKSHINKMPDIVIQGIILIFSIYIGSLGIRGLIIDLTN